MLDKRKSKDQKEPLSVMVTTSSTLQDFFARLFKDLEKDAASKDQKIPVNSFRVELQDAGDSTIGNFYAAHYFQYLIYGRGPGGMPPLDNIADWIEANVKEQPVRENKDGTFSIMSFNSLAWAIAMKIKQRGTDIHEGKRPGIDLLGAMESNLPDLYKTLAHNQAVSFATELQSLLKNAK